MPMLNKLSGAFPATLIYITLGALIDIWSLVWFIVYTPESPAGYFWVAGFALTGIVLFLIGIFLGPIGRAARTAELPPTEVISTIAQVEKTIAENPAPTAHVITDVQPTIPATLPVQTATPTKPVIATSPSVTPVVPSSPVANQH